MEFLGLQYRKMIKEASQQKTNMIIYNIAKKGFEEENSKDLMDFFSTINFKDMNISQTQYIKNLKSLEQLIFIENDPVGYIDGIVTLKKCYAQVGLKISTVALVKSFVVKFITNSFCSFIILYEYLDGRTDMYAIAGSVFIVPVHATVIIFDFSIVPQLTITAGIGYTNVPGFHITFPIILFSSFLFC